MSKRTQAKPPSLQFTSPYPLQDCLLRLSDVRVQQDSFMSPGLAPSYSEISSETPGSYRFTIKRTWYDSRYRRQSSYVELRGYLLQLDDNRTLVTGSLHTAWYAWFVPLLFLLFLLGAVLDNRDPRILPFALFVVGGALLVYAGMLISDRRTLFRVVRRALSDESLS